MGDGNVMQKLNEKEILQELEEHNLFLQNFCEIGRAHV